MGSIASKAYFGYEVATNIGAYMIYGWSKDAYHGNVKAITDDGDEKKEGPTFLANQALVKALSSKAFEQSKLDLLTDDALAKIGRQLEYFYNKKRLLKLRWSKSPRSLSTKVSGTFPWYPIRLALTRIAKHCKSPSAPRFVSEGPNCKFL